MGFGRRGIAHTKAHSIRRACDLLCPLLAMSAMMSAMTASHSSAFHRGRALAEMRVKMLATAAKYSTRVVTRTRKAAMPGNSGHLLSKICPRCVDGGGSEAWQDGGAKSFRHTKGSTGKQSPRGPLSEGCSGRNRGLRTSISTSS